MTQHTREELLARFTDKDICSNEEDEWVIDYEEVEKVINPKTKLFILNNPHNPTGKVFSQQ